MQAAKDLKVSIPSLNIAMTGATGLIGRELLSFLSRLGHRVFPLVRKVAKKGEIYWDFNAGKIELEKLEAMDAFIHLAGENIASRRWTKKKKEMIYKSRVEGTAFLIDALNGLKKPPRVFISASAIGYYGSQSHLVEDEKMQAGEGFLARVCEKWEEQAMRFKRGRVVLARFGLVLSPKGGMLHKMLLPFRWGLGAQLGSGKQLMSWISLDDAIHLIQHLLISPSIQGPVNVCTPNFVSNAEFSKVLAKVLGRPCFFSIPGFFLRFVFGEMAKEMLLSSIGAMPKKIQASGFSFFYPDLESALVHLLKKRDPIV